ncbi:MAG TPA: hypothetical protein VM327_09020 [Candidatus Thermoplasmatota archaeon]|nr:hypothetical protein [Candidatus Thermoplasmatota archaeon]
MERKKLSTTAIVILVVVGVQFGPMLVVLPAMLVMFALSGSFGNEAPDALGVQLVVLSVIAVLVGASVFAWSNRDALRPGRPVGPRRLPYDLVGGGGLGARLRRLDPFVQRAHRTVLWSLVVAVALSAAGILAAIVAGPQGPEAALFGFLLLGGWLLTVAAYLAAGYRFLLPTAAATMAFGLLLHVDSVIMAWGGDLPGSIHAVALLALFWVGLAAAVEARRHRASGAWMVLTWVAAVLVAAVPVLFIADIHTGPAMRIASAVSGAGLILCLAATIPLIRLSARWRTAALAVATLWGLVTLTAAFLPEATSQRLLAAAILVVLVTLIASVTAFIVQRPRAVPA